MQDLIRARNGVVDPLGWVGEAVGRIIAEGLIINRSTPALVQLKLTVT